ncbi:MAG: putative PEP-binding protein [Leptolyngbya sp. BL-A-14]
MANLYRLDQIQQHHRVVVGNKAFYLGQLLQKDFPVVPGFVASAGMLSQFLESIDWSEPLFADLPHSSLRLDLGNPRQLQAIAQQLRQSIEEPPFPDAWLTELNDSIQPLNASVLVLRPSLFVKTTADNTAKLGAIAHGRSSALFDIQLCHATAADVAQGLKCLWAQLFRAKSLFYWQRLGIHLQQVKLAVLVQPLRPAIASGTVQKLGDMVQIQATPGLGMAIAWGEVIPDVYQVQAASGLVSSRQLGNRAIVYQAAEPTAKHEPDATRLPDASDLSPLPDVSSSPLLITFAPDHTVSAAVNLSSPSPVAQLPSSALVRPLLQTDFPHDSLPRLFSLNDTQIHTLVQLVQRVTTETGYVASLEWTLYAEDEPPQLCLTQLITLSTEVPSHKLHDAGESPISMLATLDRSAPTASPPDSEPSLAALSQADPSAILEPQALLVSGLAAAQGRSIARATILLSLQDSITAIPPGTILVGEMLLPHYLHLIKQAAGIVLEQGSMTSHSAIIAREMGVPAVIAATDATRHIQPGELILIDGDQGRVYRMSDMLQPLTVVPSAPSKGMMTALDRPPLGTRLMVNLSQPDHLDTIAALPIDGIGLLRGELLALSALEQQHPLQWVQRGRSEVLVERLADYLTRFAAALSPRPVFYRSLDLRSHEARGLLGGETIPLEVNPTLGLHGTFSYCLDSTLFDLELAALAQVQAKYPNLHLLLPFVRTVEEFSFCRQRVQAAGLLQKPQFQLWIMAEVPSVLFLLPDYVRAGVQGIAIGTNDLTQLLLGADRDSGTMASAFDARHPAVRAAIAQLIQQAKQAGISCSICGQAPSHDSDLIEDLVQWGITSISVDPGAVDDTYWAIARAERRLLLGKARHRELDR